MFYGSKGKKKRVYRMADGGMYGNRAVGSCMEDGGMLL